MRISTASLLSFAVAMSLAGNALAQNDECTGAIPVTIGPNGPYTNVGSTTSSIAWPCASGGNDVWFVTTALGVGAFTADVCGGATYDSAIEIFNGNAGCGSLVSLGCNDDSCGLQSSISTTVTTGDVIYIRVGGFLGSTGTFTLNITAPTGGGTLATATNYGTGCVAVADTCFYENFATGTHDLGSSAMSLVHTGSGYLALPGITTYVPRPARRSR